jgi:hypothetical protein
VRDAVTEGDARHDRLRLVPPKPVGQLIAERPEREPPDRRFALGLLNSAQQPVPGVRETGLGVAGLVSVER